MSVESPHLGITWKTKTEPFGDLEITCLEDLDRTIDELFVLLEKTGKPELLEELCPYFGTVWPSARALTEYALRQDFEKDGAVRILEVGCGLAVPSLALSRRLRLSRIVATDFHPEVPRFFAENRERNSIPAERLEYVELDWREERAKLIEKYGRFAVVMGSDILYEKQHPLEVAQALAALAKRSGRIIVADPGRPYLQLFVDEMKAQGWFAKPLVVAVETGQPKPQEVFVFDFRMGTRHLY